VRRNKALAASLAAAVVLLVGGLAGSLRLKAQADEQRSIAEANARLAEQQKTLAEANAEEARSNFEAAEEQRALAEANEQRAMTSEAEAKEQAQMATERAEDVLRLSALQELDDLIAEADNLWPVLPGRIAAYEGWLGRARGLVSDLPRHRAKREEIRTLAAPRSSSDRARDRREHPRAVELKEARGALEASMAGLDAALSAGDDSVLEELEAQILAGEKSVASLEEEVSRSWRWRFEKSEDRWWHAQVTKLIEGIKALADAETGLIAGLSAERGWGVERRLELARTVEERTVSGAEALERWEEALTSIRDVSECPQYRGFSMKPQLGLLPIGRDPTSGLWEFWHVLTGEEPLRDVSGKLVVTEEMGIVLVLLPGGRFWMGAQSADPDGQNYDPQAVITEGPVHEVELTAFFLSKFELTQAQWARSTGSYPSNYGGPGRWHIDWSRWTHEGSSLHPVEQVSWYEAKQTLERLGLLLPSEAQWEYGCRGGTSSVWWSGDDQEGLQGNANLKDRYAQENGHSSWTQWDSWLDDGSTVHAEVGTYGANPFGLHDVHGNVWELCLDGYVAFYRGGTTQDPVSPPEASVKRVTRGGSYNAIAQDARSTRRSSATPTFADSPLGVRPARVITD